MKTFRSLLAIALIVLPSVAIAQQPAVGRKKVPSLTTDDVIRPRLDQPSPDPSKETPEAKSENAGKLDAAKPKAAENKLSPEEATWRENIAKARDKAKALQREAEQEELRITEIRNELGASGLGAKYRNQTAAELERAGERLLELRARARAAADDLNQLDEYGRQKRFSEAEGPKPTSEDGKPNEQFYRERFAKLVEEARDAERGILLYENRVRNLSQQILLNGGKKGGDNFYIMQLQQERDESQQRLAEARAAHGKIQEDLEALMNEARRAGVPPGVFR